jgi:ubiquinone/menaquinone biosynthesis C-methylase UbiE
MVEESLPEFGLKDYWDKSYKSKEAPTEWFIPYRTFSSFVHKHCPKNLRVLVVGCGTSSLSFEMYEEGYKSMHSVDYSSEAIAEMQQKYPQLEWSVMDVRHMDFEEASFDTIVDKGALDCLFFLDETNEAVLEMLSEVYRVLRPGGQYIAVTCGHPMQRWDVFMANRSRDWNMSDWEEYEPPDGSFTHPVAYVYCIKKGQKQSN